MRVLHGLVALADFLVSEARLIERGSDPLRKEAKEQVPGDKIKDPAALARELRWRVRLAAGLASDTESANKSKASTPINGKEHHTTPAKRKRGNEEERA